ncbi:DUF222 domain-containing protein [Zhihengliuella sp.]|uniref:DUF222 domain-containing protein n=1 Tax=Zhihengliuella sp. TaxID=1954483 RepID=UPI0028118B0B|nr:DUF222 domain-containing protein [Zhihengliuella sp.]
MAVSDPLALGIGEFVVTVGDGAAAVPADSGASEGARTAAHAGVPMPEHPGGPACLDPTDSSAMAPGAAASAGERGPLAGAEAVAALAGRFAPEQLLAFSESLKRFGEAVMLRAIADLSELGRSSEGMAASLGKGRLVERAPDEALAQEIAQVRGVSRYGAARDVERARLLCRDLPEPFEALAAGRLGALHARNMVDLASRIPAAEVPAAPSRDPAALEERARQVAEADRVQRQRRQAFCTDVLERSTGKTPGQVEGFGKRRLERELGEPFAARHSSARKGRRVELYAEDDGMCYLSAYLPTLAGEAIMRRIEDYARLHRQDHTPGPDTPDPAASVTAASGPDAEGSGAAGASSSASAASGASDASEASEATEEPEQRTLSQLMADAFVDLLLAGPAGSGLENIVPSVVVTVPAGLFPTLGTDGSTDGSRGVGSGAAAATADPDTAEGAAPPEGSPASAPAAAPPPPAPASDREAAADRAPAADSPTATDPPGPGGRPVPVAEVERLGPVDPDSLRRIIGAAPTWTRIVTDPWTGAIRAFDPEAYRPPAALRRALALRDRTCRVPGCGRRATACEPDHILEWQHGGTTRMENLVSLCKRCHRLKSWGLITCEMTPSGTLTVTTHLGTATTTYPDAAWATNGPTPTEPAQLDGAVEAAEAVEDQAPARQTPARQAPVRSLVGTHAGAGTVAEAARTGDAGPTAVPSTPARADAGSTAEVAATPPRTGTAPATRFPVPARIAAWVKASPRPWTPDHQRTPDPANLDDLGIDWDASDLIIEPGTGTPLPLWAPAGSTAIFEAIETANNRTDLAGLSEEGHLEHLTAALMRDLVNYLEPAPF